MKPILKKDIIEMLKDVKDDAEVVINIGDGLDSKIAGTYRGSFTDIESGSIILNFNECKGE